MICLIVLLLSTSLVPQNVCARQCTVNRRVSVTLFGCHGDATNDDDNGDAHTSYWCHSDSPTFRFDDFACSLGGTVNIVVFVNPNHLMSCVVPHPIRHTVCVCSLVHCKQSHTLVHISCVRLIIIDITITMCVLVSVSSVHAARYTFELCNAMDTYAITGQIIISTGRE